MPFTGEKKRTYEREKARERRAAARAKNPPKKRGRPVGSKGKRSPREKKESAKVWHISDRPGDLEDRIIADLEALVVTEGRHTGSGLHVLDWERELIRGFVHNTEVALSIGRGNGKTTFIAGLASSALDGALTRPRGQVAIVASSRDQAKIAFDHIWHFMQPKAKKEPQRWRMNRNNQFSIIECMRTGMHVKVYGSDPDRAHGLSPSLLVMDEPAKWKGGGRSMYAACVTSLGKQMNSKLVALGTRPDDEDHWFSEMLDSSGDDEVYVQEYKPSSTPDKPGWDDFAIENIRAANPSYDHMPDLAKEIMRQAQKARKGGQDLAMFRALRLNLGTPEVMDYQPLVDGDDWRALMEKEIQPRDGPVFVGIDLGGGTSMSAVALYWPVTGRLEVYGCLPAQPNLEERGKLDFVGRRYLRMEERKELRLYPGKATNNAKFLSDVFDEDLTPELFKEIKGVAADRYRKDVTEQSVVAASFHQKIEFRPVGRGPDGAQDIIAFRQEVAEAVINMDESLMLNSAIKESRVGYDENNNPGLMKKRFKGRNDALAAAVLAVGLGRRWRLPSRQPPGPFRISDFIVTEETIALDEQEVAPVG